MRYAADIGGYEIDSLPSQVQVAVCHGFFVEQKYRGKGYARILKQMQGVKLAELSYDFAICTVAGDNLIQQKVLMAAGWDRLAAFKNRRTGGTTEIWGREIWGREIK